MSQDALNELTATDATVAAEESAGSQTDAPAMWIGVVSLFPEMFDAITQQGVIGRAVEKQRIALEFWNPRDYATDRHRSVDDRPYGGGPGMLMKVDTGRLSLMLANVASRQPVSRRR